MIALLSTATFANGYSVEQKTGNVFRLIHSLPNGSAYAEFVGTLEDIPQWMHDTLASDDRARCVVYDQTLKFQ